MNDLQFNPAISVALHDSRLLISTEDDYEIHGCDCGTMKGYQINIKTLTDMLECFDMGIRPRSIVKMIGGKPMQCSPSVIDTDVIDKAYSIYKDSEKITRLDVLETGHGGLKIKLEINKEWRETLSYFGRYSVYWKYEELDINDDDAKAGSS